MEAFLEFSALEVKDGWRKVKDVSREVDSKQPAHVHVTLETQTAAELETETLRFPRPDERIVFLKIETKT